MRRRYTKANSRKGRRRIKSYAARALIVESSECADGRSGTRNFICSTVQQETNS